MKVAQARKTAHNRPYPRRRFHRFWAALQKAQAPHIARLLHKRPELVHLTGTSRETKALLPLSFAAFKGHEECVSVLLPRCNAKALDREGKSALHWAADAGQAECLRLLLPHSDPMALTRGGGWDALLVATVGGHANCVRLLLPVSNTNTKTQTGLTALHHAALFGEEECARLLIPASDLRLQCGRLHGTAFELACGRRRWNMADAIACAADPAWVRDWIEDNALGHNEDPRVRLPQWCAGIERAQLEQSLRGSTQGPKNPAQSPSGPGTGANAGALNNARPPAVPKGGGSSSPEQARSGSANTGVSEGARSVRRL